MADVYCDMSLGTGLNDGTSWANAYQAFANLSGNISAGDDVWIKGSETITPGGTTTVNLGASTTNPGRIIGVKSATTNEPPVQSDIIPGWRTGESRTVANLAYQDGDAPTFNLGDTSLLRINGSVYIYGVIFTHDGTFLWNYSGAAQITLEECRISTASGQVLEIGQGSFLNQVFRMINCAWNAEGVTSQIDTNAGCDTAFMGVDFQSNVNDLFDRTGAKDIPLIGCDLSAITGDLMENEGAIHVINSALNASTTLLSSRNARNEMHLSNSTTGKSSGTFVDYEMATIEGDVVEETTAVRTGGASDGSQSHSLAFTPIVNGTRDQYLALIGPWMAFWVDNTKTSVTVYIANSGAADYNDDDVWLEIMDVSEGGTAQHTHLTTQMDLLGTPSAVTDDTDSTWGTGGNNPQKFVVAISPDYSGWAYCRVHFAKNFSSSPETLYADPLPEVA